MSRVSLWGKEELIKICEKKQKANSLAEGKQPIDATDDNLEYLLNITDKRY